ncbi:MAG: hypothetical protein WC223_06350 [Bacteroidales bacterium]|jgi:hypothetical protein
MQTTEFIDIFGGFCFFGKQKKAKKSTYPVAYSVDLVFFVFSPPNKDIIHWLAVLCISPFCT